jgi:protein arginine N-methyltransferase 1
MVLEIGSGPGSFALLAAVFGARRVVGIEPDASLSLGMEASRAAGLDQQVQFIRGLSTNCELDEQADILISDLRGALPLFQHHIPSIIDARKRLLKPGGVQIAHRDLLYTAVAEVPDKYAELTEPWCADRFGVDLVEARNCTLNSFLKHKTTPEQLITDPVSWAILDYTTIESPDVSARVELRAKRAGIGHGLSLWFDAELLPGIGFSNAPGQPELVYGRPFLPWLEPVPLEAGDTIQFEIHANLIGGDYIWRWNTDVPGKASFRQSTFYSEPMWAGDLRKRAGNHAASRNEDGEIAFFVLQHMDAQMTARQIAVQLQSRFPERFKDLKTALAKVGYLFASYSS